MYQRFRRSLLCGIHILASVLVVLVTAYLVPESDFALTFAVASVVFCLFAALSSTLSKYGTRVIEYKTLYSNETKLFQSFIEKIRFAYNIEDLIDAVQTELEDKADCSVLFINTQTKYVVYNSPNRITCAPETMEILDRNFPDTWKEGFYFIDENLGLVSRSKKARGFFLVAGKFHFYVLCRYVKLFDIAVFPQLLAEFEHYLKRSDTISELSEIAELSKEWALVAKTQMSFLPSRLPEIAHLDTAAYFRPLVNVSGDYYHVLPVDEHKTLFLLGDVSGKRLAAALIMGVVINTIKIISNKTDLPGMIRAVDRAIKGMSLQDKYTVLFAGIVDTEKMTIRYVNASMSDPLIVTQAPGEYKVKRLVSNCGLVGIIDLDEIHVDEQNLFRGDMILMASDGVSEVMNREGVELGDNEIYMTTIKNSAHKAARHFVGDIADLVLEYNGEKKLRDDVTMLAVKVER